MRFKIFVINLDESVDRLHKIKLQLEEQNLLFERIVAVDMRKDSNKHLLSYYNKKKNYWGFKRYLSLGEIGCYLSHRECWKKILDEPIDYAIILEDDVKLVADLNEVITCLNYCNLSYWEYLKIGETPIKRIRKTEKTIGKFNFVCYQKLPSGTFAQIVNKTGANKLLQNSQNIYRPVDMDIQFTWKNKIKAFGLLPYSVEAILEESDIARVDSTQYKTRPLIQIKNVLVERFHRLIDF